MDHAKNHEFADITWYPSKHTAVYRYDDRVSLKISGNGIYDFIGFQSNSIVISKSIRATGKLSFTLLFFFLRKLSFTFTQYFVIYIVGKLYT